MKNDLLSKIHDEVRKSDFRELTVVGSAEVESLPRIFAELPSLESSLRSLKIRESSLQPVEQVLPLLKNLRELDVRECGLDDFPESLTGLTNLDFLIVMDNRLSTLPASFARLAKLRILDLQRNQFSKFPAVLCEMPLLESLGIGDNPLEFIPNCIGKLTNLNYLSFYRTGISELPSSLRSLKKLTQLQLWNNRFTKIPSVIYELSSLEELSFTNDSTSASNRDNNMITRIPAAIMQLNKLTRLDLKDNPIEDPPPEVVAKGVEAIHNYFKQLENKGKDYLFEAKLLIVGEGGAGKTTLAKKIKDLNYQLRDEDSTKGIEVTPWSFPLQENSSFRVNIWDFGGQEIYHATHQFFLTKRSLYVLVADARKEDTDFHYWLTVVSLLSDNSPVIIVENQKQDRQRGINDAFLRSQFPNIVTLATTNLLTNRGLAGLVEQIKYSIRNLPHIGTPLPRTWVRVREKLEKDERNFISLDEYLDVCSQNGFTKMEDKLQLSGYLHDLGVCLHFREDPVLGRIVILKPRWGTDAVYKVLDNGQVIENSGQFSNADLAQIWSEKPYENMRAELLQLMMNFGLCYRLPQEGSYIAPQLLSDRQPQFSWNEEDNLSLRYTYEFMPKGIVTRFIVVMHEFIAEHKYVWKSGVLLQKERARARVDELHPKREIRVSVAGQNKLELLTIIAYEIDKIHATYKDLRVTKQVPCNCSVCKGDSIPNFYALDVLRKFIQDKQEKIQCLRSYQMVEVQRLLMDVNVPAAQVTGEISQFVFQGPIQQVVVQTNKGVMQLKEPAKKEATIRSAWANGSFYLFCFIVVIAGLGVIGRLLPIYALPLILVAAILCIPIIGALQLMNDGRVAEKSFLQLMGLVFRQLPLIEKLSKTKHGSGVE